MYRDSPIGRCVHQEAEAEAEAEGIVLRQVRAFGYTKLCVQILNSDKHIQKSLY